MAYIEFKERGSRIYSQEPAITITVRGTFSVGKLAYERYLSHFKFVRLFYDPDRRVIGILPTNEKANNAFPIRVHAGGNTIHIASKPFFDFWNIEYSRENKRYLVSWNEEEGKVEIDLKQ